MSSDATRAVASEDQPERSPTTVGHRFWGAGFLIVWIFAIAWIGLFWSAIPGYPSYFTYLYQISALFPRYTPAWEVLYLQAQREGDSSWVDLPKEVYFSAKSFGYLSRLDVLFYKDGREFFPEREPPGSFHGPRFELTMWLAGRYGELNPGAPRIETVRYVRARYLVGVHISEPEGRWIEEPLGDIPEAQKLVIGEDHIPTLLQPYYSRGS